MKKRIICLLITLVVAVSVCCALSLSVDASNWHTSGNLKFRLDSNGNSYIVAKANEYITTANIPNTFNGKPVTSTSYIAFKGCEYLNTVTIPNTLTWIDDGAFSQCTRLTSVTIPDSVTHIGIGAFFGCSRLTSVTLPDSLTDISHETFARCTKLTNVTIPNSVTYIGWQAFQYCSGLTSVIIPNGITSISEETFEYCRGLTSVTIGNSVTSIGDSAFAYCSELKSVTIPSSVTFISNNAFAYCQKLETIYFNGTETQWKSIIKKGEWDYGAGKQTAKGTYTIIFNHECADSNKDHKCDTCGKVLNECADANKDHNCDICGKKLTDHTGGKATCKEKASCSICGQKYGDLADHTYKATWSSDSTNHWHECSVCGSKKDEVAHTPGAAATETTPQTCTTCGYVIKAALGHTHNFNQKNTSETHLKSSATCTKNAVYYYSCSCGEKGTTTFEYGNLAAHTYKTAWTTDAKNHWHECSVCGSKKDEAAHADANKDHKCDTCSKVLSECADTNKDHKCDTCGKVLTECADANKDHNCDICGKKLTDHTGGKATCKGKATCSICGQKYGNLADHTYKTTWSSDSANHWHECSVCGSKKDEAAHTPGAAATETTAQVCTVCNYVITPALGHTHSFTKRVDERYLKSKATCTAKAVYYYSCSCGAIGNSTFEYGELAEHTAMYFWSNDRTGHWHECSTCGKKLDLSVHIPNRASATETEPVVCTVCGYLIEAAHGHIHNITGYWEKDEENHWHSCTGCDLRFDLENHVFTLVADKRNAGSSVIFGHEECVTCGLKKGSLLYGIEPGTTVEKLKKALGKDIVVNGAKNGLVGTGTKVVVGGKEYTVIIKGDIDGDGKITATDYIRVRLHILKRIRLDGEKLLAAHASTEIGKNVSAADYIAIRLHILKKKLIAQ